MRPTRRHFPIGLLVGPMWVACSSSPLTKGAKGDAAMSPPDVASDSGPDGSPTIADTAPQLHVNLDAFPLAPAQQDMGTDAVGPLC